MNLIHPKTLGLSETSKMTVPEAQKGGQFEMPTFGMNFASLGDQWLANGVFPSPSRKFYGLASQKPKGEMARENQRYWRGPTKNIWVFPKMAVPNNHGFSY